MTHVNPHTSWTETAYDWFQRSKRKRAQDEIPKDPSSAAWSFFRSGSGISFMDAAFRRHTTDTLPVIHLMGDVAKTWTLLSLAARFVVQTRPSQFTFTTTSADILPQVLWLDSHQEVIASQLAHVVRSTLLRHMNTAMADVNDERQLAHDLQDCCERIHVARVATDDWVPLLECWRHQLAVSASDYPTLILWDGFLEHDDDVARTEIVRQLSRLLEQCSVVLVTASSSQRNFEWDRFITQRVRLQRNAVTGGHEYLATVQALQIPFSISASGILS
ncbi:hypothetical protein FisN_24Lh116 [Fistulifera solaris]|uniref:Uncharacterized protein n=1 Tax=Fistulifera solaris TaxID=1519565 RepID=A0A1Z5K9K2_FISSO|nr:hypothetical protein FisN_24Lh116 [Fistulifera solaris]|eukprot:GAX22832.1 hypothetical protein FisN_24Lh116 [Fistulifera solaris]